MRAGCTAHHWRGCCEKHCAHCGCILTEQTLPDLAHMKMEVAEGDFQYTMASATLTCSLTSPSHLMLVFYRCLSRMSAMLLTLPPVHVKPDRPHTGASSIGLDMSLTPRRLRQHANNGAPRQVELSLNMNLLLLGHALSLSTMDSQPRARSTTPPK